MLPYSNFKKIYQYS